MTKITVTVPAAQSSSPDSPAPFLAADLTDSSSIDQARLVLGSSPDFTWRELF